MLLMLRGRCLSNPSDTVMKELPCWINTLMTAQVWGLQVSALILTDL